MRPQNRRHDWRHTYCDSPTVHHLGNPNGVRSPLPDEPGGQGGERGELVLVLARRGSLKPAHSFVDARDLHDSTLANGFVVAYRDALGSVSNGG